MSDDHAWNAPGPGPWQQDSSHNPVSQSRLMQQVYPVDGTRRVTNGTRLRVDGTTGQVTILG